MGSNIAREVLERLRALREELALRQDYLAKRVGVDRTTYVRKEQGVIPITTEEWIKLAAAMDREPAYFFAGGAAVKPALAKREALLLRLYRSLRPAEQEDFVCAVYLKCRSIRRKAVQETLKLLQGGTENAF